MCTLRNRVVAALTAVAVVLTAAACSEKLESDGNCPALCPNQGIDIVTATLTPVVLDTALQGVQPRGTEAAMLLTTGAGIDVRGVVRFDTLDKRAARTIADSGFAIVNVDSAYLKLRVDTTSFIRPLAVTIDAFDVDTMDNPTDATVASLFRPDRLIGSITVESLLDTISVPIDTTFVRAHIQDAGRIRIGLRVTSAAPVQLRLFTIESSGSARLVYRTAQDTVVRTVTNLPISKTPVGDALASELADYTVIVAGTSGSSADIVVGGLPGSRSYLRFNLPTAIIDSATVTSAVLELTQRPDAGPLDGSDSLLIVPRVVIAGAAVTDPARASVLVLPAGSFLVDSIRVAPGDSGVRRVDVTRLVRAWKGQKALDVPHAIVLRTLLEGITPLEVRFFSSEAADPLLRPRLVISYIPKVGFGLP